MGRGVEKGVEKDKGQRKTEWGKEGERRREALQEDVEREGGEEGERGRKGSGREESQREEEQIKLGF